MTGWWLVLEVVVVAVVAAAVTTWVLVRKGLRELSVLVPPVGTDSPPAHPRNGREAGEELLRRVRHRSNVTVIHPDADNPTHTLGGTS